MSHFEERHRHLREMLAQRGAAWREGEEDGVEVIDASRRLDAFHEVTGPLVDDLVAAVREENRPNRERLGCEVYSGPGPHVDCGQCWGCRVLAALAALDAASGSGKEPTDV